MKRSREPDEAFESSSVESDSSDSPVAQELDLPVSKITELDPTAEDSTPTMRCSLPPHKEGLPFGSYEDYEAHYNKSHLNRCLECRSNFPSQHLLDLHIEECHDVIAAVKRERGEHTFSCFVEGCDRKCRTPQKRRMHLIDKHMYPRNFFFAVTKEGVDGRRSLLLEGGHRRRRSSNNSSTTKESRRRSSLLESQGSAADAGKAKDTEEADRGKASDVHTQEPADKDMDDLTGAMSSLNFVPSSVRFGRGGRAGFSRR